MKRVKEVIVVEGRYDKNALSQVVQATILETSGFRIFSRREQVALLRRLAEQRGLIVLTDSDGAGFTIRNFLKGAIPGGALKQAYIPDQYGKERRKRSPGKEGKVGVEGMPPAVLLKALTEAGATFLDEPSSPSPENKQRDDAWTKADLYELGLLGRPDCKQRRGALLRHLSLPEHLSTNALVDVLSMLYTRTEIEAVLSQMR